MRGSLLPGHHLQSSHLPCWVFTPLLSLTFTSDPSHTSHSPAPWPSLPPRASPRGLICCSVQFPQRAGVCPLHTEPHPTLGRTWGAGPLADSPELRLPESWSPRALAQSPLEGRPHPRFPSVAPGGSGPYAPRPALGQAPCQPRPGSLSPSNPGGPDKRERVCSYLYWGAGALAASNIFFRPSMPDMASTFFLQSPTSTGRSCGQTPRSETRRPLLADPPQGTGAHRPVPTQDPQPSLTSRPHSPHCSHSAAQGRLF